jgi:hypothetical protein
MTRILLTGIIILSFSFLASAQFNKGNILLGGNLSYTGNTSSGPGQPDLNSNYGNFSVSIGKALNENSVFGINISFSPNSTENNFGSNGGVLKLINNNYSAGVFYRKYKSLGKDFFLFGEVGGGYTGSTGSTKDSSGNKLSTSSANGGNIYFYPGISYKISKKFFLELTIPNLIYASYSSNKFSDPQQSSPQKNTSFDISTSLSSNPLNSLGIGFRLII